MKTYIKNMPFSFLLVLFFIIILVLGFFINFWGVSGFDAHLFISQFVATVNEIWVFEFETIKLNCILLFTFLIFAWIFIVRNLFLRYIRDTKYHRIFFDIVLLNILFLGVVLSFQTMCLIFIDKDNLLNDGFIDLLYFIATFGNFCAFIYIFSGILKVFNGITNFMKHLTSIVYSHPSVDASFRGTFGCISQYYFFLREGYCLNIKNRKQKQVLALSIFFIMILKELTLRIFLIINLILFFKFSFAIFFYWITLILIIVVALSSIGLDENSVLFISSFIGPFFFGWIGSPQSISSLEVPKFLHPAELRYNPNRSLEQRQNFKKYLEGLSNRLDQNLKINIKSHGT